MSSEDCTRKWEVEALLDGRLAGPDARAFDRHLEQCERCARELREQRELLAAMRELPVPSRTELESRRARQALLAAADARLLGRRPAWSRAWRYGATALAAAAAVAIALIIGWRGASPRAPVFDVTNVAGAQYETRSEGSTTRVALRDGKAGFQVEPLAARARFVVALPDGEIEVRGTRFVVTVEAGRTTSVVVNEGTVALTLPEFVGLLGAGEQWPPSARPAPEPTTTAVAAVSEPTAGSAEPTTADSAGPSAASNASSSPSTMAKATGEAGARFAAAMAAYSAGNYGEADRLFAAFVRDYSRDARAEDATFLRADARSRLGDAAGAATAAREYLRAFPNGLRRREAERIAGER